MSIVNKYLPIVRKIVFLIFTGLCVYYTYLNLSKLDLTLETSCVLFDSYAEPYYEMITDNTGYTNIVGISNFINNLKLKGYVITTDRSTDSYLDYTLESKHDEIKWRVYYNLKEEYIAIFSSDYESSAIGYSYIIEEY